MSEIWPQIELGPSTDITIWKEQERKRMEAMKKEPKFCNRCGEVLIVKEKIGEFNIYTGDKILNSKTFRCPHYNRIFGRFHYMVTRGTVKPPPVILASS